MSPHDWLIAPAIFPESVETALVAEYLGAAPGVFVEVGANHPVRGSQSWHLEQAGWTGLLVEPLAEKAAELRRVRTAAVEEVACGPPEMHGSTAVLHVRNYHSTLTVEEADAGIVYEGTRTVPVRTLDSLLERNGIGAIDFLSVDVEGFEPEVLAGLSLKYRPRLVLVEDKARGFRLHRLMAARGYRRVRRSGLNSWYVPVETEFPISLAGRAALFRKYVVGVPMHRLQDRRRRHARKASESAP